MADRCDCCDLPVESCGKAAEKRERAAALAERERLLAAGALTARYAGLCSRCSDRIREGDPIKPDPDREGGWLGECCA